MQEAIYVNDRLTYGTERVMDSWGQILTTNLNIMTHIIHENNLNFLYKLSTHLEKILCTFDMVIQHFILCHSTVLVYLDDPQLVKYCIESNYCTFDYNHIII